MHSRELWHSPRMQARLARAALTPASWLYALGWEAYLATYRLGLKKPAEPHSPVICVGNLQVGGSGKSPLTLFIAKTLQVWGKKVIVSCSGYGSPRAENATLAPSGELSAKEWGDEPAMFRWLAPDLPLIVGRNRVEAAKLAHTSEPDSVLLLDDGFQHLPLKKHTTIVLDPLNPDNPHCLPAGPYREPRRYRNRADLVVPGQFRVEKAPTVLEDPHGVPSRPPRYSVLCALGAPERFLADLEAACPSEGGYATQSLLEDHDPLDTGNLFVPFPPDLPIVVTAKDWVKLRERADVNERSFLIAKQDVRMEPLSAFETWLRTRCRD